MYPPFFESSFKPREKQTQAAFFLQSGVVYSIFALASYSESKNMNANISNIKLAINNIIADNFDFFLSKVLLPLQKLTDSS